MAPSLKTLTITEAKKRLLELADDVTASQERVAVTRNGLPTMVLLSLDDYESLIETLEILSSPGIRTSLKKSLQQMRNGQLLTDAEVWDL